MPRPKNANLTDSLWSQNGAHDDPGETWHDQPSMVEPANPQTGHLPGERPPAEEFNWWKNRLEKIARYLDTIDVRNFMPPVGIVDLQIRGLDWEGARYVAGGNDGDTPANGKALSSPEGWNYDSDESAQLTDSAEYADNPADVVASGRRVYLITDGAVQIRSDFNSYTTDQISETFSGTFYSHRPHFITQAWKDPEIEDTVWTAWVSQKSPPGLSDWISIGRVGPTGLTWTTGVNAGTGRSGLNTGRLWDPGTTPGERAMFADLPGKRVCVCNGPNMSGNQMLVSIDEANDFLSWSSAGQIAGITGTIVGLERSGDFLVAVTDGGRCYRSADGTTWALVNFPPWLPWDTTNLSPRMTFLSSFSPAMIRHGSVLVALGELSPAVLGGGGEGLVLVGSVDHGDTWEVLAGYPVSSQLDFIRIRSMQDGRIVCLGYDGTNSQVSFSLRTRALPVGSDAF